MAQLKVPSLQHLARLWAPDPFRIKNSLLQLANSSPPFSYAPLYDAARDMLVFGQLYDQIVYGFRQGIKWQFVLNKYLSILPRLRDHFAQVQPDFVQGVGPRYYPVAQGLLVPFQPPLLYGKNGELTFPWFIFWQKNPIVAERLSLFVSVVDHVLLQDPDLESAKFQILDFSGIAEDGERTLTVIDTTNIPRLSEEERTARLEIFAEGYLLAKEELERRPIDKQKPRKDESGDQRSLLDD